MEAQHFPPNFRNRAVLSRGDVSDTPPASITAFLSKCDRSLVVSFSLVREIFFSSRFTWAFQLNKKRERGKMRTYIWMNFWQIFKLARQNYTFIRPERFYLGLFVLFTMHIQRFNHETTEKLLTKFIQHLQFGIICDFSWFLLFQFSMQWRSVPKVWSCWHFSFKLIYFEFSSDVNPLHYFEFDWIILEFFPSFFSKGDHNKSQMLAIS